MSALPVVDWENRIITIPKNYEGYTLLQPSPEILQLDTNRFRNDLRTLEANPEGAIYERTHNHNTEVTLSGITFARVVEILAPYTITFEDGQYRVVLAGSNNNILDVANVNQVSIAPTNSAGLIGTQGTEAIEYRQGVTIDASSSFTGTLYPVGTLRQPSSNVPDANIIAQARGFKIFYVSGGFAFGAGDDLSNKIVIGDNELQSSLVIGTAADTLNTEFRNAKINGLLDNNTKLIDCDIENLDYVSGRCVNCQLLPGTFRLGGNAIVSLIRCYSGVAGEDTPTIDMNGLTNTENPDFIMRDYVGGVRFRELTGGGVASVDMASGQVRLVMNTMTSGSLTIRGVCKVVDDTTGERLYSGTYNGGFNLNIEAVEGTKLSELFQRFGLDPNLPLVVNPDGTITVGDITIIAVTDGGGTITATRQ